MNNETETDETVEEFKSGFRARFFAPKFRDGLERYFLHHIETGGFLRAVLENNLKEAVARADHGSKAELPHLVEALLAHAPAAAWGSKEKVAAWLGTG